MPEPERSRRTAEMLAAVGIAPLARRYARELSGGEVQRIAIARALVHRPRLLLADEPTGNLDPRSAAQTLALLRAQVKANAGAGILITHSRTAADTADRILVLDARRPQVLEAGVGERRARFRAAHSRFGACCCWRSCANSRRASLVTVLAIALGVALGAAVYLVNNAALNEFGLATKRLVGEADVVVRGPREGFPEQLFALLARDAAVSVASPVLELDVALPGRRDTLKVLGLDPFRAAALQPALIGDIGGGVFALFQPDAIYLSSSAAQSNCSCARGDLLQVIVGSSPKTLRVLGILSQGTYSQALGLMDIASAQWTFDAARPAESHRFAPQRRASTSRPFAALSRERLPAGVLAIAPQVERDRAVTVTRAYRVNLNMLALVALWTGAFLVFSTQSLSVLRRRRSLALLRALGVTRGQLQRALIGEGAALGVAGSLLGVILGLCVAAAILRFLTGDLGNGQLRAVGASLRAAPLPMLAFFAMGIVVAEHRRLAAGALRGAPTPGARLERRRRRLRGGGAAQRVLRRRAAGRSAPLLSRAAAGGRIAGIRLCRDRRAAVRRGVAGSHTHRESLEAGAAHAPHRARHRGGAAARKRRRCRP